MQVKLSEEMVEALKRAKYVMGLESEAAAFRRAIALLDIMSTITLKGQEIAFVEKGTDIIKGKLKY